VRGEQAIGYDETFAEGGVASSPPFNNDFAPEVEERKIIKSASISSEVDRGEFMEAEQDLKNIISATDSFILNENVNRYGPKNKKYFQGSYQLRIDSSKYESIISQLKNLGEVQHFSENTQDITGGYTNSEINLEIEKSRLERYRQMYEDAESIADKLQISDRIFNQERTVKYLEDSLKNFDQRIDYVTVYFTLTEEQSKFSNIAFLKLSEIVKRFIGNFNSLIYLIFSVIPWAIFALIVWFVWKIRKKRK